MLESLFNKVAGLKRLHYKRFPMIFVKFSKTPIFKSPLKIKQRFSVNKLAKKHNGEK